MSWLRGLTGWHRAGVLAAVAVAGMALGAVLAGSGGGTPAAGPNRPTAPPATVTSDGADVDELAGPGPRDVVAGVGVGFSRDEAGAVAAAMSYVTAPQSWLYLSDEVVTDGVEAVTVPEARDDLVGDTVQQVRLLRDELDSATGTVWFVVSPLATSVEDYTEDRAVVRVWVVRVLSAEGVAVPQSGWQTLTVQLRWHEADWKIAALHEAEGPVPQLEVGLQPWDAAYLDSELTGFVRVGTTP